MTYISNELYIYTLIAYYRNFIFNIREIKKSYHKIQKSFKIHNTMTRLKIQEYNSKMTHCAKIKCTKMSNRSQQIFLLFLT